MLGYSFNLFKKALFSITWKDDVLPGYEYADFVTEPTPVITVAAYSGGVLTITGTDFCNSVEENQSCVVITDPNTTKYYWACDSWTDTQIVITIASVDTSTTVTVYNRFNNYSNTVNAVVA